MIGDNGSPRQYPDRPIAGVGVVAVRDGRVLLVRRGQPPAEGRWSIPGGAVELGETARQAARREVREETGLELEIGEVVDVVDIISRDERGGIEYHFLLVDFRGHSPQGELTPGDDVVEARWVSPEEIASLPVTESLPPLLAKVFAQ